MMTRWMMAAAVTCTAIVTPALAQQADDAKASLAESAKAMQSVPSMSQKTNDDVQYRRLRPMSPAFGG